MEVSDTAVAYSSRLSIDLDALRANYRSIADHVQPAACGAVIKADAYGLGAARIASALYGEGCRHFFVAQFCETRCLTNSLGPDAEIYVLNGIDPGGEAECLGSRAIPVLNSSSQLARWRAFARADGRPLPAALQVDTGMSRLGLEMTEVAEIARDPRFAEEVEVRLLMTHLACADDPDHDANAQQSDRLDAARFLFPHAPVSIANSAGAFLPERYRLDLVRPGIALYGVSPGPHAPPMRPVVRLDARVLQVREVAQGTGVGYGFDHIAGAPQRLATIAIGYGDGWPRCLGGSGAAWHGDVRLPIVGRVSMDSMTVDISELAEGALAEGDFVELVGPSQSLTEVAHDADTIAYELLTRMGPRHARCYHENGTVEIVPPGEGW